MIINLINYFNQLHSWHAIRNTYNTTLQATPSQILFGRDMIDNIAFRLNYDQIQKRNQDIISKSNKKQELNFL
jgi:hypothetical protein